MLAKIPRNAPPARITSRCEPSERIEVTLIFLSRHFQLASCNILPFFTLIESTVLQKDLTCQTETLGLLSAVVGALDLFLLRTSPTTALASQPLTPPFGPL